MASFKLSVAEGAGLEDCEFDVLLESGQVVEGELFPIEEDGSLWEYITMAVEHRPEAVTLFCKPWIPSDGAFVGIGVKTRAMTAVDRRRYGKFLAGKPKHR